MRSPDLIYAKTKSSTFLLPRTFPPGPEQVIAGRDTQGPRRSAIALLALGSATLRDVCTYHGMPVVPAISRGLAYLSCAGLVEIDQPPKKGRGRNPKVYISHADLAEVIDQVPSWKAEYEELTARQQETISPDQLGQLEAVGREIGGATLDATIDYLLTLHRKATE